MSDAELLKHLRSPFYRVAIKALIFDDLGRLLVVQNDKNEWEIPGGGWEYDETMEACLRRELLEETNLQLDAFEQPRFVFSSLSDHGWHVIRIFYPVTVKPGEPRAADDIVDVAYVTKEALLQLNFTPADAPIKEYITHIWS